MISARRMLPLCAAWGLLALSAARAQSPDALPTDIAAQPLAQALTEFANQTGLQLVYVSEIAATRVSRGAPHGMSTSDALARLLDGTGLGFEFLNERTIRIFAAPGARAAEPPTVAAASEREARHRGGSTPLALEEVVVTANRREELLGEAPLSIAAWTQQTMLESGIRGMTEIGALTPAVEFDYFSDLGPGIFTNVSIRGVNSSNGSSTAIYYDDTPIPAQRDLGSSFGRSFPVTFDLDRVEVLRGPQSTLLGEGAEGGAIRFIPNSPSLTSFGSLVRTEIAATEGGDLSYEAGAAAGGPIRTDVAGYRVSGWYRSDGGFVDRVDPFTGATVDESANRIVTKSFRGALTFVPTDRLEVTPSLTWQDLDARDSSVFFVALSDPGAGVLRSGKLLRQPVEDGFYLASVKVTAALDSADLTSVTSYLVRTASVFYDATNNPMGWGNPQGPEYPDSYDDALPSTSDQRQIVLSQELRLTSAGDADSPKWIAGAFVSRARDLDLAAFGPTVNAAGNLIEGASSYQGETIQADAFGEMALKLGERLTANLGARLGYADYDASLSVSGPTYEGAQPEFSGAGHETQLTPKFTLSYRPGENHLWYFTAAKGYRMGGVNSPPPTACATPTPATHDPDYVWNYELGTKSNFQDGRVRLNASVFHIDWHDVQNLIFSVECGYNYFGNIGTANSNGFDFAAQALLTQHFNVDLSVAYTDAYYTHTVRFGSFVRVNKGDAVGAVPVVPSPWNVTASFEYHFPIGRDGIAHVRALDAYHSQNPGPFYTHDPESPSYDPTKRADPATNVLNMQLGVNWSEVDVELFVNNVLDSQPTLFRRNPYPQSTLFFATTFRPRTIGLSASWHF